MHVNGDTLSALQIFFDESHPNMHNTRRKEGLSLFGLDYLNLNQQASWIIHVHYSGDNSFGHGFSIQAWIYKSFNQDTKLSIS